MISPNYRFSSDFSCGELFPHDNLSCGEFFHITTCYVEKFLHIADFFSTGTARGAHDKYQVWDERVKGGQRWIKPEIGA